MSDHLAKANITLALPAQYLAYHTFLPKLLTRIGQVWSKLGSKERFDKPGVYLAASLDKHRLSATQTEYDLYSCRFVR